MNINKINLAILTVALLPMVLVLNAEGPSNKNKVDVLVEGYVKPIAGREFIPGVTDDGARKVASTVALVRGENVLIVVDPGMVKDVGLITKSLEERNIQLEEVTHVFISHHHPDHTVNIGLFTNAELVDYGGKYKGDVWEDHKDGYVLAAGIKVLKTPGHTKEDASLVVETAKGIVVFTHLWWLPDLSPKEDPLAWNQGELEKNRKQILEIADWIVPGHGKMFKNPSR